QCKFFIDRRNANASVRLIQSFKILFRPEKQNFVIFRAISFQTFKYGLTVMKHFCSWIKLQWLVRYDAWIMPAFAVCIIHNKHMIGIILSEFNLICCWFLLAIFA